VTRGKKPSSANRFQSANVPPFTVGDLRNLQRAEVSHLNDHGVYLRNPDRNAPFQKNAKLSYRKNVGLQKNPRHFYEFIHGDAGAGQTRFRRLETLQLLGADGERASATPYSKPVEIFTCRSTDNRPRYWQANLYSVARTYFADAGDQILTPDQILQYAPGIPAGTPTFVASSRVAYGIPLVGVAQFRVMVFDESGQRFFDVDVLGVRGVNAFAWGMTVFALLKEDSFVIDRQLPDSTIQPFNGMVEQSIIGARVIPIQSNNTRSIENRTVTTQTPPGQTTTAIPVPPGTRKVQISCLDGVATLPFYSLEFRQTDPLNPDGGVNGTIGTIDFEPGKASTTIYDFPNANTVYIRGIAGGTPSALWSLVFEVQA